MVRRTFLSYNGGDIVYSTSEKQALCLLGLDYWTGLLDWTGRTSSHRSSGVIPAAAFLLRVSADADADADAGADVGGALGGENKGGTVVTSPGVGELLLRLVLPVVVAAEEAGSLRSSSTEDEELLLLLMLLEEDSDSSSGRSSLG